MWLHLNPFFWPKATATVYALPQGTMSWSQFKAGINLHPFLTFEPHRIPQIEFCKVRHQGSNEGRPTVKLEMLLLGYHVGARATVSWAAAQDRTAPFFAVSCYCSAENCVLVVAQDFTWFLWLSLALHWQCSFEHSLPNKKDAGDQKAV